MKLTFVLGICVFNALLISDILHAGLPNSFVQNKIFMCFPLKATWVYDVTKDDPPQVKKITQEESIEKAVTLQFQSGNWINISRKDSKMNLDSSGMWNILHADNGSSILKILGMSSSPKEELYEYAEVVHSSADVLVNHGFCMTTSPKPKPAK